MSERNEILVLDELRKGRRRWSDLERALVKGGMMSRSTLSSVLKKLESDGRVRRILDSSKRPAVAWYSADSEPSIEGIVQLAVEELRREVYFLREPTIREVALKVGDLPENVRTVLYHLAPKIGWKEQSAEEAEEEAATAIALAGWMKYLAKGAGNADLNVMANEDLQKATRDTIARARRIYENYPDIVPHAEPAGRTSRVTWFAGLEWNQATEEAWQRVFKSPPRMLRNTGAYALGP